MATGAIVQSAHNSVGSGNNFVSLPSSVVAGNTVLVILFDYDSAGTLTDNQGGGYTLFPGSSNGPSNSSLWGWRDLAVGGTLLVGWLGGARSTLWVLEIEGALTGDVSVLVGDGTSNPHIDTGYTASPTSFATEWAFVTVWVGSGTQTAHDGSYTQYDTFYDSVFFTWYLETRDLTIIANQRYEGTSNGTLWIVQLMTFYETGAGGSSVKQLAAMGVG